LEEKQRLVDSAALADLATAIANSLAERRGVPLLLAFVLVVLNFVVQFIPGLGWFAEYDVLLHLGVLLAIGGVLLASAL
jgi:hypothetical protein